MHRPWLRVVLLAAWLSGGQALAASPVQSVEGQLALDLAQALAERGYGDRARAILEALPKAHPERAAQAKELAAQLEAKAKPAPGAEGPAEYREALEKARKTGLPMMLFFGREACGLCRITRLMDLPPPDPARRRRLADDEPVIGGPVGVGHRGGDERSQRDHPSLLPVDGGPAEGLGAGVPVDHAGRGEPCPNETRGAAGC